VRRKLYKEEVYNFQASKTHNWDEYPKTIRWTGHTARIVAMHTGLLGRQAKKRPLWKII